MTQTPDAAVRQARNAPVVVPGGADAAGAVEANITRVAVSTVIFSLRRNDDESRDAAADVVIPLVRRLREPHEGLWALPGGWL
ncbi:MAG: hypothetical protein ACTH31_04765, partial [Pseudoclavibacter sp.]